MRLLRTARHLRGRQIVGQVVHRARRALEDPGRVLNWDVPAFPGCVWRPIKPFLPPGCRANDADALMRGRFTFLNRSHDVGWPPSWDQPQLPKLWQYNLHYFEFLWAMSFEQARFVTADWIDQHSPARGRVGWDSYPTSLRLMDWCAVFFEKYRRQVEADELFRRLLWGSIYRQSQWLAGHLETHLMGNHLLENAAALAIVGSCFDGPAAARWFGMGLELLRRELNEQILPDGGHFELSPMYQCRVVYLLAMLANVGREELTSLVGEPLHRAIDAMKYLCHPDGQIALLNDAAMSIYNEPAELARYAEVAWPAPAGRFALPDSGYYGARTSKGHYIVCDAGAIGPDHLPGHAHGDMLSFELSLRGHRVIVDAGVFDYEPGEMRSWCRGTRAHNTVEIDAHDQCEFWGAFRVARRGPVRDVRWIDRADGFELHASHDGYARLAGGGAIHSRTFRWHDSGELRIRDVIRSTSARRCVSRLHLHPDCRIRSVAQGIVSVDHPVAGCFRVEFSGEGRLGIEKGWYCPHFGIRLENAVIAWSATRLSSSRSRPASTIESAIHIRAEARG